VAIYSVSIVSASALTAAQGDWKVFPVLPFVFACYHFGYGWGFLRGVWDFVIWRRGPNRTCTELTRSSENN
jgi:succinoglycan biosynthesis protein ExoA